MIIATVVSFAAKLKDAPIRLPVVDNIEPGCVCVWCVWIFYTGNFLWAGHHHAFCTNLSQLSLELRAFVLCSL